MTNLRTLHRGAAVVFGVFILTAFLEHRPGARSLPSPPAETPPAYAADADAGSDIESIREAQRARMREVIDEIENARRRHDERVNFRPGKPMIDPDPSHGD